MPTAEQKYDNDSKSPTTTWQNFLEPQQELYQYGLGWFYHQNR